MFQPVEILPSQRTAPRRIVSIDCKVNCDDWDEPMTHQALNISQNGVWLSCESPLDVNTEVMLTLVPPGESDPIHIHGDVRRTQLRRRRNDSSDAGMGVRFNFASSADEQRLRTSIHKLPPAISSSRAASNTEFFWVSSEK